MFSTRLHFRVSVAISGKGHLQHFFSCQNLSRALNPCCFYCTLSGEYNILANLQHKTGFSFTNSLWTRLKASIKKINKNNRNFSISFFSLLRSRSRWRRSSQPWEKWQTAQMFKEIVRICGNLATKTQQNNRIYSIFTDFWTLWDFFFTLWQ